jgi:DNA-binding LacI/PurR family transcriptional regulator/ABC-type glycerol-3-phosphate transport system substrate-binding protein
VATIKDVAKAAGVSLGTVSNVLNNKGTVNPKNVKRVQEAIRQLGYTPDAAARSLKTNQTMSVGVILPTIMDPNFAHIFTGIERVLSEHEYAVSLYTTSEIPAKENLIIERICQQRMDGVIVVTCQPHKGDVFKKFEDANIKMVFLEREVEGTTYNYLEYNNYRSIYDVTLEYLRGGVEDIVLLTGPVEYSSEQQCIKGYQDAYGETNIPWAPEKMLETNLDKESAFKAIVALLKERTTPAVCISSSTPILEGVIKAIAFLDEGNRQAPVIIGLCEETWADSTDSAVKKIPRRAIQLGELAAETLLEHIKNPVFFDVVHQQIENGPLHDKLSQTYTPGETTARRAPQALKVFLFECASAHATSALLPDFSRKTGIQVAIEILDYNTLYEAMTQEFQRGTADVFQIDLPWFTEFAADGCLVDLSEFIGRQPAVIRGYVPGVLDVYAKYHGKYFALPYMFGTQLLFYRKDLFEDSELRMLFREQYHSELQPPKTWKEFNVIARFFTQAYNPKSPVHYGATLGGKKPSGAVCEFLLRQWAYRGETLDEYGNLILHRKENVRALENYIESYRYASENATENWWTEQIDEFSQGKAAMMVAFTSHVTELTNRARSKIVGKIGAAVPPGGCSVLGGWSLGINARSRRQAEAFQFVSWATSQELAIPHTIMGGATPSITLYKSSELLSIYPWLPKVLESFAVSRKRRVSKLTTDGALAEKEYENILGEAIHHAVTKRMTPEDAIQSATEQFQQALGSF